MMLSIHTLESRIVINLLLPHCTIHFFLQFLWTWYNKEHGCSISYDEKPKTYFAQRIYGRNVMSIKRNIESTKQNAWSQLKTRSAWSNKYSFSSGIFDDLYRFHFATCYVFLSGILTLVWRFYWIRLICRFEITVERLRRPISIRFKYI